MYQAINYKDLKELIKLNLRINVIDSIEVYVPLKGNIKVKLDNKNYRVTGGTRVEIVEYLAYV